MASVNDNITLYEGAGAVMNSLYKEVTGQQDLSALPSGDFVSVATKVWTYGTDMINQGLARVLTRTFNTTRSYGSQLSILEVDSVTWGGMQRKLHPISDNSAFIDTKTLPLTQGSSVDPYTIHKHPTFQMFIVGESKVSRALTRYDDQLEQCFFDQGDFANYLGMVITEVRNEIVAKDEEMERMTLANFVIGNYLSDYSGDSEEAGHRVIHAITAYNTYYNYSSGDAGYIDSVATATKTPEFWKWLYVKIGHELEFMASLTHLYNVKLTDKPILKHTSKENRRILINSEVAEMFNVFCKASTYHDNYLEVSESVKKLPFWQNPKAPMSMKAIPTYLKADGTLQEETDPTTLNNIALVIYDKDAMAVTRKKVKLEAIRNPAGLYENTWYHATHGSYVDFCENGIVVCLD